MNGPIRSPRFTLQTMLRGFSAACVLAAILVTSGCVGVTGKGSAPGSTAITLGLSPSSVSFGDLSVGQSSSKTVTLTNTGSGILMITGISVAGTGFTASGPHLPIALSAGQSTTISVVFKPTAGASDTGTITITSNALEPTMDVSLSGTGTTKAILNASASSVAFGTVSVGSEVTKTVQLANAGTAGVTISGMTVSGTGVSVTGLAVPANLGAGQDANLTITYKPNAAGTLSGKVSIASNASDPSVVVDLSGTATTAASSTLTATPSSITFGNVVLGSESSQTIRLANSGTASVTVSSLAPSVSTVSISGITVPLTLAPGATANFTAAFKPTAASSVSGAITVKSNATDPSMPIDLTGTGQSALVQLTVSPTSVSFGSAAVGTANSKQVIVKNTGNTNASISSVAVAGTGFSLSGSSTSVVLDPGQSITYTVNFDPKSAASDTGALTVASNASGSPMNVVLSGTGTTTSSTSHSVALNWDGSSSTVVGYFVYRSSKPSGPYAKMNPSADSSTSYSDTSVAGGQVYYYVVTAVDSSNIESSYSNQVSVTIPTN